MKNICSESLVIGCNYHTKWQSNPAMRFVLVEIKGDLARLKTRSTQKDFWVNVSDLIFIESKTNIKKAITASNNKSNSK